MSTPVSSIARASDDRYIVTISRADKVRERTLMDEFGRISDVGYYNLSGRKDEYFEAEIDAKTKLIIDKNGTELFRCLDSRDKVYRFRDGIAVYQGFKADRRYFVTMSGEILGGEFKNVCGFANGLGVVVLENGRYVMVDKNMQIASPEFEFLYPFYNKDYTIAKIDDRFVVINSDFQIVSTGIKSENGEISPYGFIFGIDENGIMFHQEAEGDGPAWSYVDVFGNRLGGLHNLIHPFVEGVARVQDPEGTSYVNMQGEYITKDHFINCSDFSEGYAVVGKQKQNVETGITDPDVEQVFAFMKKDGTFLELDYGYLKKNPERSRIWFPYAADFSDGIGSVIINGNTIHGVTKDGKVLKGKGRLGLFHEGMATYAVSAKKWSYVDEKFEPFKEEFDSVSAFHNGYGIVSNDKKYDCTRKTGIKLSAVSECVAKIDANPYNVLRLPESFYFDEELVSKLLEVALDSAKRLGNDRFISSVAHISDILAENVANAKKIFD